MKVRKAKLTAMLLNHHFVTGIELKCFRQLIIWPVMSTLNYHEMLGKVNCFAKCSIFLNLTHKNGHSSISEKSVLSARCPEGVSPFSPGLPGAGRSRLDWLNELTGNQPGK